MRLRTYLRGKNFKPRYFQPDAAEYFAQLQAVEQGLVAAEQSWINFFPGYAATPIPARDVDPEVLRKVLSAICEKNALKITYQSMSRPEPAAREIEPHALAFDGFRWHARAFCRNDTVFKDFLLSRIVVRKALLFYALKRLGLDTDPAARRLQDQQIVLMNAPEIGHSAPRVPAHVSGGVNG